MKPLRKIPINQPLREFPAGTFNELVSEVESIGRKLATIEDTRSPKSKSTAIVQIVWQSDDAIEPGETVKLDGFTFDPSAHPSAPFRGLVFHARPFTGNGDLEDYAITLGPIKARVKADGALTTRTDDNTGTLTMDGGHGITTGRRVTIEWDGGRRIARR